MNGRFIAAVGLPFRSVMIAGSPDSYAPSATRNRPSSARPPVGSWSALYTDA